MAGRPGARAASHDEVGELLRIADRGLVVAGRRQQRQMAGFGLPLAPQRRPQRQHVVLAHTGGLWRQAGELGARVAQDPRRPVRHAGPQAGAPAAGAR
jgi:hypothetical protein